MAFDREPPGSPEVFGLAPLIERYRGRLEAMIRCRIDPALGARLDAESILQDALLRASTIWQRSGPPAMAPYPWLYRIALDCLIDAWRRQTCGPRDARRDMPWPERSSVQLGLGLAASTTTPSGAVVREELRDRVRQALDRLSEDDRNILWMRHFDELDHREIAQVLGISADAAIHRYVRALKRFKVLWLDAFGGGDSS
jgi:RNA polymerase sigma-70 factor (ECF subfamily)